MLKLWSSLLFLTGTSLGLATGAQPKNVEITCNTWKPSFRSPRYVFNLKIENEVFYQDEKGKLRNFEGNMHSSRIFRTDVTHTVKGIFLEHHQGHTFEFKTLNAPTTFSPQTAILHIASQLPPRRSEIPGAREPYWRNYNCTEQTVP